MSRIQNHKSVTQGEESSRPISLLDRRLKMKPALFLFGLLFLIIAVLIILLLLPNKTKEIPEEVATVGDVVITREQWMHAMEKEIGKETLLHMVNEQVMAAAAKEYGIEVTDQEVELEFSLLAATDRQLTIGDHSDTLKPKIKSKLILEKVLTNDIVIDETEVRNYYDKNQSIYSLPESYRTSLIIVDTKEEAQDVLKELKEGSTFELLAKERSIDNRSSNLGGDIGFINEETERIDEKIIGAAKKAKVGKVSSAIPLENGTYALVLVQEVMKEQSFTFDQAKGQITRMLAMDQLPTTVRPESFWKEFKAKWIYE